MLVEGQEGAVLFDGHRRRNMVCLLIRKHEGNFITKLSIASSKGKARSRGIPKPEFETHVYKLCGLKEINHLFFSKIPQR